MTRPIRASKDGTFRVELAEGERELLNALVPQLREMLVGEDDPDLRRLFPAAYADDAEREQEYALLTHDELLAKRLADLDALEAFAAAEQLSEEQVLGAMGAVNSLRLVLGTRLDVSEDMDDIDAEHPDAPAIAVYHYLSYLLEAIVSSLTP